MPVAKTPLQIAQVCKLIQLVYEKDKAEIQKLIGEGIPHLVNYNEPSFGRTALIVATMSNSDNMLEFLLELGAHPDVVDFKGTSAAMIAAEYGHIQCLERLVNNKANMQLVDDLGRGILFYMFTPSQRHYRSYELAIQHGADVNTVAKDGTSALQLGCESAVENEQICLGLLRDGINPDIRPPKTNHTPLMSAAKSGSAAVVKGILEKRGDPNIKDWKRNRAAHFAAAFGHFEVLAALAGYGGDFDCANVEGNTALHLAAKGNFTICCRFLAQRGCNGKYKNSDGSTARFVAKESGNKQAAKECKKGEKLHGKSGKGFEKHIIKFHDWIYANMEWIKSALVKYDTHKNGILPAIYLKRVLLSLDAPITYEELDAISKPLEKSGSINTKDFFIGKKYLKKAFQQSSYLPKEKKTKKERAAKAGKFKLPMAICTNPSAQRTSSKQAPLDYIQYISCVTDTNRFDRDIPPTHPMQDDSYWYVQMPDVSYININEAVRCNDEKSLKTAFEQGTPVDTKDKYFKTPLMIACAQGNVDMVKMLLEQRASVTMSDNFKWTPLHHACHGGQLEVVKLIVERGADLNARAMNGGTPLTRAIESSAFDVVQYLIEKGAKLVTETRKGLTPLDIAWSFADPRVINAVSAKWTPPIDKFKKIGKGKKPKPPVEGKAPDVSESPDDLSFLQKSAITVFQLAETIMENKEEPEDISYNPPKPWIQMPNTDQLMARREAMRDQFGWKVDFTDFLMPFKRNVLEQAPKL